MRTFLLPLLLAGPAALAEGSLTLDPDMYAAALREVQQQRVQEPQAGQQAQTRPELPAGDEAEWCLAMQEAGTSLGEVRLILLLQRLNPGTGAEALAEALDLHRLMQAGNAPACMQLAAALRSGTLPGGLAFIRSAPLAEAVERRAAAFQPFPGRPTAQPSQSEAQPESAAKASGASA